jgi:uncharacterized protein (TIGR00159 family)
MFGYFPTPGLRDVVDILFLTLVGYQLYEWFRETRALRVIIGLFVLGVIYSLAKLWGLFLTTWVFQFLWQVLLILLLILFQAEIRQVLEKVSPLRYLRSRRQVLRGNVAHDLGQVVFELARERTGALIVLAREDNPAALIQGGQPIMALPEPHLIKSIFNRHSPLHDGAIVISGERMTHMGCILPLSQKDDIPDKYGTRHRAALGLSEASDAVCLVVSEERAEVASVSGGRIIVWQSPEALAARIKNWIGGSEIQLPAARRILQQVFVYNWKSKLVALTVVTIAWGILAGQQDVQVRLEAPVSASRPVPGLAVAGVLENSVTVTLSGSRRSLDALRRANPRLQVNLSGLTAGTHVIRLSEQHVDLPPGVRVDRFSPPRLQVTLLPKGGDGQPPP